MVEREHGGEDEHGRLGERVRDLLGERQRGITRPHRRLRVSQEPEGVAETAEADRFRIQPIVEQVGASVVGTVAFHGGLEVPAGDRELRPARRRRCRAHSRSPPGARRPHCARRARAIAGQTIALGRKSLWDKLAIASERRSGDGSSMPRVEASSSARRCTSTRRGEANPSAMPSTAGRAARMAISRVPRSLVSGSRRSRSSARSSRRAASALACSRCAASAARRYQSIAASS